LQLGELPVLPAVVGQLVVGKRRSGDDVCAHAPDHGPAAARGSSTARTIARSERQERNVDMLLHEWNRAALAVDRSGSWDDDLEPDAPISRRIGAEVERRESCSAADGAERPGAHCFAERVLLVGALPGEFLLRAPEVPVGRGALVDGPEEIEVLDDLPGLQAERAANRLGDALLG